MSFTKAAESSNISRFEIYSNQDGKSSSLLGGAVNLYYYESIFENSVKITSTIVDTGNAILEDGNYVEVIDGLKIGGGEKILLDLRDNQGTKLRFSTDNALYLNQLRNTYEDSGKKKMFTIDASSKEFFDNELTRVVRRYNGRISESVKKILTEVIKTPKSLEGIEDTVNDYNFLGVTKKPFWTITWLAKKSVANNKGKSAGYLFYETYDGFNFKSIDRLFAQTPRGKYIYNNTAELPPGYTGKIINPPVFSTNIHLQPKLMMGTYNTEHKQIDFYKSKFELKPFDYLTQEKGIRTAGREFEFVNEEFTNKPSRITYNVSDIGGLPEGKTLSKQLEKSKEINLERQEITNQANMRYNQLGTIQVQVMLVGDFSLRAGDLIECDFPELSSKPNQQPSKKMSGIYMIADVCHRITPNDTLTSLNLIRDSYGRKSNA